MIQVYVRAKTSDGRWASVNAVDLDERSFRQFILEKMADAHLVGGLVDEDRITELSTPLTKAEADPWIPESPKLEK